MYDIMNKTAQKMVKWQFPGFKDIARFGSVTGILSYFSWQLTFPGALIKFRQISRISRSYRNPEKHNVLGKEEAPTEIVQH